MLNHSVSKSQKIWMVCTKHVKSNVFLWWWFWQWTPRSPFAAKKWHQNPPTVGCKNCHRNCQRKCSEQRHLTVLAVYWSDVSRPMKIHNHQSSMMHIWSANHMCKVLPLSTYSAPAHPTHWLNAAALEHSTNHPAKKKTLADSSVHQTTHPQSVIVTASNESCWWNGEPCNYRKLFFWCFFVDLRNANK